MSWLMGFDLQLSYPWMLIGIPLFYGVFFFNKRASSLPLTASSNLLRGIPRSLRQQLRAPILHLLLFLILLMLFLGASRPQNIIPVEGQKHRNLMLILDVSPSMEARDFLDGLSPISRIEGVKKVVSEFIHSRVNDRIGIGIFGGHAFLQSPLTTDHHFLLDIVEGLQAGMAGDGTAIGDGLGVGLKRIKELPAETRAIILLTDGANNAGSVDPNNAAEMSNKLNIKIHTIGIGSENAGQNSNFSIFGPSAEYDEATLRHIANLTHGVYFNAGSTNGLREVYKEIDALVESELKDAHEDIVEEYYPVCAKFAFIFLGIYLGLFYTIFMKVV